MRITVLGVPIDVVVRREAAARISAFLDEPRGHMVATPNPEMLVMASRRPRFREVLSAADLNIADGVGLVYASRWYGARLPERIAGADLVQDIAELAARRGRSVFLLGGGSPDVASDAAEVLKTRHPHLRVVGATGGGKVVYGKDGVPHAAADTLEAVRRAAPDILLVAFGHGKQEEWIAAHIPELPSVRVAMGVGGTFDFISGRVSRAPAVLRRTGLEWLWRLVRQPWRTGRIATAVFVFPYLVLRERIGKMRS